MKLLGRRAFAYVAIIMVPIAAVIGVAAAYNPHERSLHDAISYLVFLREDGTTFAAGYTEAKFDEVKLGMAQKEVRDILGEPLITDGSDAKCYWSYTDGPREGSYWLRDIMFENGRVAAKFAYYFAD